LTALPRPSTRTAYRCTDQNLHVIVVSDLKAEQPRQFAGTRATVGLIEGVGRFRDLSTSRPFDEIVHGSNGSTFRMTRTSRSRNQDAASHQFSTNSRPREWHAGCPRLRLKMMVVRDQHTGT
jgi:hypothetical protein